MKTLLVVSRAVLGITFLVQLVLGVLFFSGHALNWVGLHMNIGMLFVLGIWTTALACARIGAPGGLVAANIAWGALVLWFGWAQVRLVPGPAHWTIQVTHLLLAFVAMALSRAMSRHAFRRIAPHGPFEGGHPTPMPGRA